MKSQTRCFHGGTTVIKKGISTRDLRPFSIDDPFGLGIESPTQVRFRERFHRKSGRKRTTPSARLPAVREQRAVPRTAQSPPQRTPQKTAPPVIVQRPVASKTKSKGTGCFTTLIILGAIYAAGHAFIPPIWNALTQEIVLQTGQNAQGQILFAQPTSSKWNENVVYEVTLEVHAPGQAPYQATIKQALSPELAAHLVTGAWVELRYDSTDLQSVAIHSLGAPDPRQGSQQQDPILDLQQVDPTQIDPTKMDPAQILEQVRKQTEALKNLPGLVPPREAPAPAPPNPQAPRTAPAAAPALTGKTAPISQPSAAPAPVPAPQPVVSVSLACLQASACCRIAEGSACASFSSPGTEEKACKRALRNFTKAAEAAGKSCSGLP